jgi:hypothetical protein
MPEKDVRIMLERAEEQAEAEMSIPTRPTGCDHTRGGIPALEVVAEALLDRLDGGG